MKILVLYSEMAGYFLACIRRYAEIHQAEIHIVRWKVNAEAPFDFEGEKGITWYERDDYDAGGLITLGQKIQPDLVYVTGWIDKAYLKVASHFFKQAIPVIGAFDTKWRGDFRQKVATWLSPFVFRQQFSHVWVSGLHQYEYARRLGFPRAVIQIGMYSADTPRFEKIYHNSLPQKAKSYPHTLLFVGRFVEMKRVQELAQAFRELSQEMRHDWKLVLVGNGPLREDFPQMEKVEIHDFVQPEELPKLAATAGAFILSSFDEPWGVAMHEFAAAGLPILASEGSGASTAFLRHGYNGYLIQKPSVEGIKTALRQLFSTPDAQLLQMGEGSLHLSRQISPDTWAATLNAIAQKAI